MLRNEALIICFCKNWSQKFHIRYIKLSLKNKFRNNLQCSQTMGTQQKYGFANVAEW